MLAVDITKADGTVLVPAGTTFSSSITPVDGYGYEVETVLADGSTVVFVFYYAGVWFNPIRTIPIRRRVRTRCLIPIRTIRTRR